MIKQLSYLNRLEQRSQIDELQNKFNIKKSELRQQYLQRYNIDMDRIQNRHGIYIQFKNSYQSEQLGEEFVNHYLQYGLQIQRFKTNCLQKQNQIYTTLISRLSSDKSKHTEQTDASHHINSESEHISIQMSELIEDYRHKIAKLKKQIKKLQQVSKVVQIVEIQVNSVPNWLAQKLRAKSPGSKQKQSQIIKLQITKIISKIKQIVQDNQILRNHQRFNQLHSQSSEQIVYPVVSKQQQLLLKHKNIKSFEKLKDKISSLRQQRDELSYEIQLLQRKKDQQIRDIKFKNDQLKKQLQNLKEVERILSDGVRQGNSEILRKNQKNNKIRQQYKKFKDSTLDKLDIILQLFPNKEIEHQQNQKKTIVYKLLSIQKQVRALICQNTPQFNSQILVGMEQENLHEIQDQDSK